LRGVKIGSAGARSSPGLDGAKCVGPEHYGATARGFGRGRGDANEAAIAVGGDPGGGEGTDLAGAHSGVEQGGHEGAIAQAGGVVGAGGEEGLDIGDLEGVGEVTRGFDARTAVEGVAVKPFLDDAEFDKGAQGAVVGGVRGLGDAAVGEVGEEGADRGAGEVGDGGCRIGPAVGEERGKAGQVGLVVTDRGRPPAQRFAVEYELFYGILERMFFNGLPVRHCILLCGARSMLHVQCR
jgi:hypothetical protein